VSTWLTVLTSAAVGVLVSSVVTLWGQYLERGARRKELLLTKALEMAKRMSELRMRAVDKGGGGVKLYDEVVVAEIYFRWLESLQAIAQPSVRRS